MTRFLHRAVSLAILFGTASFFAPTFATTSPPFDPKPWLDDLEQTRQAVATKYANVEGGVSEREIALGSLFTHEKSQLKFATSKPAARAVFDRLARRFGDGHV